MSSFLPASIQKRLLRYALSRLELLDTDALDLEHLDLSWGSKSTLEFRNVSLQLKKLQTMLQLPPNIEVVKAQVLLLRVTVPVDIHSSPIVVEADGVEAHVRVSSESDKRTTKEKASSKSQAKKSATTTAEDDANPAVPSATDLAQSFYQTEPPEERAELETAMLSQSEAELSDDGDGESSVGTGTALALPAFMANFLKGIMDRIQIRVHGITLNVDVDIPNENLGPSGDASMTDLVTLQIRVEDVDIEGVTSGMNGEGAEADQNSKSTDLPLKDGKRLISFRNLRGFLVSDEGLFTSLALAMSSSSAAHSDLKSPKGPSHSKQSSAGQSKRSSLNSTTTSVQGNIPEPNYSAPASVKDDSPELAELPSIPGEGNIFASSRSSTPPQSGSHEDQPARSESLPPVSPEPLNTSRISMESSGRFDDASEDEDFPADSDDEIPAAMMSGSILNNPAFLDDAAGGYSADEKSDDSDSNFPFGYSSKIRASHERSQQSTPRASSNQSAERRSAEFTNPLSLAGSRKLEDSEFSLTVSQLAEPESSDVQASHATHILAASTKSSHVEDQAVPERSQSDISASPSDSDNADSQDDLLTHSIVYSQEEAGSIYMSAMSHSEEPKAMPGGWTHSEVDEGEPATESRSLKAEPRIGSNLPPGIPEYTSDIPHAQNLTGSASTAESATVAQTLPDSSKETNQGSPQTPGSPSTPRLQKARSNLSEFSNASESNSKFAKELFNLDHIGIYIPSSANEPLDGNQQSEATTQARRMSPQAQARARPSKSDTPKSSDDPFSEEANKPSSIDVAMGHLSVHFDVSVARLLYKLFLSVSGLFKKAESAATPGSEKIDPSPSSFQFHANRFSLNFLERLPGARIPRGGISSSIWANLHPSDVLLRATMRGLNIKYDVREGLSTAAITLQKFVFGYAEENILSFDPDLRMKESVRDLAAAAGVDISINMTKTADDTRFKVSTLPVHVSINLQKLDDTFGWLGGLSSILNMTNSIASNSTTTVSTPTKSTPTRSKPRGVHFDKPAEPDVSVLPQNKVDARIGGFILDLIGKSCSVGLDTSAIKIISRREALGIGIDQMKISGPHLAYADDEAAIKAQIIGTRIEVLGAPKDTDLDRLLALITPSKARYDRDDDILLDTLLRQRRKGAVLRVTVDNLKSQVSQLENLKVLPDLCEELSKLSTVAKYLPEDDRPGLLSLAAIRHFDLDVDTNTPIGSFRATAADVEAAQITLPSLIALSMGTLSVHRNDTEELLGPASNAELRQPKDRSPAVMARMIGDEMEPIVKIKLWNLKAEYNVPTLMTLLGLGEDATTEDMATGLAASVATLTDVKIPSTTYGGKVKGKRSAGQDSKALTMDLVITDCVLGLNPLGLQSKVLVVMTEAHFSGILPKDNSTSFTAELGKGSLLAIDDIGHITAGGHDKKRRRSFHGGITQIDDLCSQGFVTLGYLASAKAIVQVSTAETSGAKSVDVKLHDDLLVLESCADSTQTLITALNALVPPSSPSKEVKYRTNVMPMEDLLASFTGDAFESLDDEYDFDKEFGSRVKTGETEVESNNPSLDLDLDYYAQDPSPSRSVQGQPSQHGSLLFDQDNGKDSDDGVLIESFTSKQHVHIDEELDFKEDYFGSESIVEDTGHRWNSAKNTYDRSEASKVPESPLKVSVRDVHIIWNLYDGYDWQTTRDTISGAVQDVENKAISQHAQHEKRSSGADIDFDEEDEAVIGDCLFNSVYIGIPANRDPRELALAINQELHDNATETESMAPTSTSNSSSRQGAAPGVKGRRLRLNRSKHHKITFELKGVNADLVTMPPNTGETQSSVDIRVRDFDIYDHVPTSTWKKFATYMHDAGEREADANQLHIELLTVRPVPDLAASEMVLRASVLPLRLHVDQDALDFLTRFFQFRDDSKPPSVPGSEPPFVQRAEINDIPVMMDFKPKRVDYAGIRSGHTTEFMNFIVLDQANMVLRHTILYGVSGFDRLGKMLNDVWMPDIKQNQLPGILAGLAPVRNIANFGGGVRDLVEIPIREYRKDGRMVRAMGKGAAAFAKTSGTELIKLGAKLAIGTQTVLEGAEGLLGKPAAVYRVGGEWEHDGDSDSDEPREISLYADQPVGVAQGLRGAYRSLEKDLITAKDAIIAVPGEAMESGSAAGAMMAMGRRAPTVILRPLLGGSKALGKTLLGVGNWADPANLRRAEDKYKRN